MNSSRTHLVLVPSYNSGPLLEETIEAALAHWRPVWLVVDGSTDGSERPILDRAEREPGLRVIVRERNGGKGAAVLTGAQMALAEGFTHALVMDADGQHPADRIQAFMQASRESPPSMILGRPIFGPEAPLVRLKGRQLSVAMVRIESLGGGIDDPLFGFRVYPLVPLMHQLVRTRFARRYDFDPEVVVRLFWAGTPSINLPATCRYRAREEGGISHFNYVRDNVRMVWLHARLLAQLVLGKWIAARRAQRARQRVTRT